MQQTPFADLYLDNRPEHGEANFHTSRRLKGNQRFSTRYRRMELLGAPVEWFLLTGGRAHADGGVLHTGLDSIRVTKGEKRLSSRGAVEVIDVHKSLIKCPAKCKSTYWRYFESHLRHMWRSTDG